MNVISELFLGLLYAAMLMGGIGLIVYGVDEKEGTFAIAGAMLIIAVVYFAHGKATSSGGRRDE
jgi:hypothetical protein